MSLALYFFLYPAGHFGFPAVTFLVILPLVHVIDDFLIVTGAMDDGVSDTDGLGVGEGNISFT